MCVMFGNRLNCTTHFTELQFFAHIYSTVHTFVTITNLGGCLPHQSYTVLQMNSINSLNGDFVRFLHCLV